MPKRITEPDEAFGPPLNGLDFPLLNLPSRKEDENGNASEAEAPLAEAKENIKDAIVLVCGTGLLPSLVGKLAKEAGFTVQAVVPDSSDAQDLDWAELVDIAPDYFDLAAVCNINRNTFVCVFVDSPIICEDILAQCLITDARYLGVEGDYHKRDEIFTALKTQGTPDAELAAISCPMGLNLGAESPEQKAIAIVAELLGAWSGALKSLKPGLLGLHR